jgi:hypothetical protein
MATIRLFKLPTVLLVLCAVPAFSGGPTAIDTCPAGPGLAQPPSSLQLSPAYSGDGDGLRAYDDFSNAPGPITGLVWWGGGTALGECVHENNFEITFYEDNGAQPGGELFARTVSPTVTSTEFSGPQGTIYRHAATFETPVALKSGWVSVYAVDFDGCFFYWATALSGNNNAYLSATGNVAADFAYCLNSDAGPFADTACIEDAAIGQDANVALDAPGFSDAGDGTLAYENFSGLEDPIDRVVWWGGGTAGGNDCARGGPFELAFYQDNGGQPGALVTAAEVTASVSATGETTSLGSLNRYEAVLASPVTLASGWISIQGLDFVDCYFYWANGTGGNGSAYTSGVGTVSADFALCLFTEDGFHTGDQNGNNAISLSELLRVIQFYNSGSYGCELGTEDDFAPNDTDQNCLPHNSDYSPQNWTISLSELLRLIQFYNTGGYAYCPEAEPATEDRFCPGAG